MKLFIKFMVSIRCKLAVKTALDKLGLHYTMIELGEVQLKDTISEEQKDILATMLQRSGLKLMEDNKSILIEKVKNIIIEMIHYTGELPKANFSDFLEEKLGHDYKYISNLFSETTGITIEHFIIAHKVERTKELLLYNELSLKEIAKNLHYSSVAHLSNQFKKATGLTPIFYRNIREFKSRIALENV